VAAQRDRNSQAAYHSDGEGYGNDGGGSDGDLAEGGWGDVDFGEAGDLIEAPRKVAQIGINYARASKQVQSPSYKRRGRINVEVWFTYMAKGLAHLHGKGLAHLHG
jgi:hypothetical protein